MGKSKRSVRSQKKKVAPPVVLFVAEVEAWHHGAIRWRHLAMVRPSSVVVQVKRDLLKYARKRQRWVKHNYGVKYRIRAYTRVEGTVVENDQLHKEAAKPEGVTA